ncbi:MAG: SDR family oxidoreductase [Acidobacteriota bacterium]
MSGRQGPTKVALVTGGTRRLGFEFSKALVRNGYSVALSYRTSADEAGNAVDILRKEEGARVEAFRADFASDGAPELLFKEIFSSPLFGSSSSSSSASSSASSSPKSSSSVPRLHALVHAASPWIPKPFASVTLSDWEAIFRSGPRAAFFLAQAAAPALRAAQGSILLVSDVAAVQAWPTHVPHSAAKAAINSLVMNLAVALGPDVRVNAVAPGIVLPPDDMSAEAVAALVAKTPLARRVAVADLMGLSIAILENRSMTGQIVAVDAGRSIV